MTRRSKTDIMHDVLKLIAKGVVLRTHIMYQSNTSWTTIIPILQHLINKKYITYDGKHYNITDKGANILKASHEYMKIRP